MTTATHTPGPWSIRPTVPSPSEIEIERMRAAAPDLLEACRKALRVAYERDDEVVNALLAAIDKAEGEVTA